MPCISQDLSYLVERHSFLEGHHRTGHDIAHWYEVQADPRRHIAVQYGHTLDLQYGVVQTVTDGICYPLGHDDGNKEG